MASIISAGTTSATALNMSADTSGVLQLASNNGTVAATVDTGQKVGIGLTTLTERFEVNGAIGASTTSSNNFATGNARAFMDYVPGSNTARLGQLNGASGLTTGKLSLFNNGLESIAIDASGRVLTPYQPAFKAYPSSNISVSSGVTNLTLDTTSYNVGSHYSTSTGLFTAPVAGVYFFEAATYIASVPDGYYGIRFSVNGSNAQDAYVRGGFGDCTPAFTFVRYLSANDTVRISSYYSNSATIYAGVPASHFSGYLLG